MFSSKRPTSSLITISRTSRLHKLNFRPRRPSPTLVPILRPASKTQSKKSSSSFPAGGDRWDRRRSDCPDLSRSFRLFLRQTSSHAQAQGLRPCIHRLKRLQFERHRPHVFRQKLPQPARASSVRGRPPSLSFQPPRAPHLQLMGTTVHLPLTMVQYMPK